MPTEQQRRMLAKMMSHALLQIRGLGNSGQAKQAADLADAFHNLPVYLWSDDFSFSVFKDFLQAYQRMYPETASYDYLGWELEIDGSRISIPRETPLSVRSRAFIKADAADVLIGDHYEAVVLLGRASIDDYQQAKYCVLKCFSMCKGTLCRRIDTTSTPELCSWGMA
jgi:hypothetical protein